MSISVSLANNIDRVETALRHLPNRTIVNATRKAIRRSMPTGKKIVINEVKKERVISTRLIREKLIKEQLKLSGNDINRLEGSIGFKYRKMSLRHFVRGHKNISSQRRKPGKKSHKGRKGKPYPKRRKIRVMVKPGVITSFHKPSDKYSAAFIQRGKRPPGGGEPNILVFQRNRKTGKFRAMKVPSPHNILLKHRVRREIETSWGERFLSEFEKAAKFRLMKLRGEV